MQQLPVRHHIYVRQQILATFFGELMAVGHEFYFLEMFEN